LGTLRPAFATKNLTQLAIEVAPEFIQVRRATLLLLWTTARWLLPRIRLGACWWNITGRFGARFMRRFVFVTAPTRVIQIEHASDLCGEQ
jgi:hypothetical protein